VVQELFCKVAADHFDCYLDADGGKFRLTPEGDGLRLEVTGGGGGTEQIVAEGTDWGEFGAPRGDDRVFILRRADRKLCSPDRRRPPSPRSATSAAGCCASRGKRCASLGATSATHTMPHLLLVDDDLFRAAREIDPRSGV